MDHQGGHLEAVPGGRGGEIVPRKDTAYTVAGPNTGLPANLMNFAHYPVEAICTDGQGACGCGQVIRSESFYAGWYHTGRKPGET